MDRNDAALAMSTVALVPTVYGAIMPTLADTRANPDVRGHLAHTEVVAAGIAGGLVLGMAAVTRSAAVAGVGLVAVGAMAYAYSSARSAAP